ncbi:MAG: AAC(3) family N-acetyltransferase [Alphaproteobacteria bacterium]|tara:strand:- start:140 stop:946 length:807 start_codon:yes stop_codon:yes gene_type:complete
MQFFSEEELKQSLNLSGIVENDIVIVHCSIIGLGLIKNKEINEIPKIIVDCILNLLGKNGTLSVPTFNYSYINRKEKFDTFKNDYTKLLGALPGEVLSRKKRVRSFNPGYNISTIGAKSKYISSSKSISSFGSDSSWDRLFKLNSKIVLINCDLDSMTFIRYIESKCDVPYLYSKLCKTPIYSGGKKILNQSTCYLRYKYLNFKYNLENFEKILKKRNVLKEIKINDIHIRTLSMRPTFEIGVELLNDNIYYFLEKTPTFNRNQHPVV